MILLAIDPGNIKSAWVLYNTKLKMVEDKAIELNEHLVARLADGDFVRFVDHVAIEYPAPRGQPMYTQLVDTIFWIGRFVQAYGFSWTSVDRKDVKMHLCGSTRAKDSNIRAAIISIFSEDVEGLGGGKIPAVGTLKKPGKLYKISKDLWAALGVALTYAEQQKDLEVGNDPEYLN